MQSTSASRSAALALHRDGWGVWGWGTCEWASAIPTPHPTQGAAVEMVPTDDQNRGSKQMVRATVKRAQGLLEPAEESVEEEGAVHLRVVAEVDLLLRAEGRLR